MFSTLSTVEHFIPVHIAKALHYKSKVFEIVRGVCIKSLDITFVLTERMEGRQKWRIQKESCPLCKKKPRDCF